MGKTPTDTITRDRCNTQLAKMSFDQKIFDPTASWSAFYVITYITRILLLHTPPPYRWGY